MDKQEMPEAMIVVGPFLWKCVNCNILMSRQHSIDYHLNTSHHSKLHPEDIPEKDRVRDCKISSCCCHYNSNIQTRKRNRISSKKSPVKKKRMIAQGEGCDSSTCDDSDKTEEGKLYISQELWQFKAEDADDKVSYSEAESVNKVLKCLSLPVSDNRIPCETNGESQASYKADLSSTNSEDKGIGDVNTVLEKISSKQDLPVIKMKIKNKSFSVLGYDVDTEESGSTRKSRRSNKGRNSNFKEFEMGNL